MAAPLTNHERNHAIDFLKIAAAILIVFHNYTKTVYVSGQGVFCGGTFDFSRCAELFFVISGYLMCKYQTAIQKREINFKQFYGRRALRLLPLTALSAVVYEVLIMLYRKATGTLYAGQDISLSGPLFDSYGIQAGWVVPNPMINDPIWHISVLMLCYLIFYLINLLSGNKKLNANYFYIGMLFLGMGIISFEFNLPFLNSYSSRGYCSFFTGILLANVLTANRSKINKLSIAALIMIAVTILAVFYYAHNADKFEDHFWLTFISFPSLIILAETPFSKKLFAGGFWPLGAKVAFNVFIWHTCLMIVYKYLLLKIPLLACQTEWKMMLCALAIDCIVGILSYRLIEKPLTRKLKRLGTKLFSNHGVNEA